MAGGGGGGGEEAEDSRALPDKTHIRTNKKMHMLFIIP